MCSDLPLLVRPGYCLSVCLSFSLIDRSGIHCPCPYCSIITSDWSAPLSSIIQPPVFKSDSEYFPLFTFPLNTELLQLWASFFLDSFFPSNLSVFSIFSSYLISFLTSFLSLLGFSFLFSFVISFFIPSFLCSVFYPSNFVDSSFLLSFLLHSFFGSVYPLFLSLMFLFCLSCLSDFLFLCVFFFKSLFPSFCSFSQSACCIGLSVMNSRIWMDRKIPDCSIYLISVVL